MAIQVFRMMVSFGMLLVILPSTSIKIRQSGRRKSAPAPPGLPPSGCRAMKSAAASGFSIRPTDCGHGLVRFACSPSSTNSTPKETCQPHRKTRVSLRELSSHQGTFHIAPNPTLWEVPPDPPEPSRTIPSQIETSLPNPTVEPSACSLCPSRRHQGRADGALAQLQPHR